MFEKNINQQCFCFNIRKISRIVTHVFDWHLNPIGITSTQFAILSEFSHATQAGYKNLTEIANELGMERTTLSHNLRPLQKLALIRTQQEYAPQNPKYYVLTEKGIKIMEKAIPLWEIAQKEIKNGLKETSWNKTLEEITKELPINLNHLRRKREG
jgi:DNA-binding MarR family transcriptional regulator